MNTASGLRRIPDDLLSAVQFLTRIPVPMRPYYPDSLARAVAFFPLIGALLGIAAAFFHRLVVAHVGRPIAALLVVIFLVWTTGCLHEDGLADAADGLGGGHTPEQILRIFRDSRIGTYGAAAVVLSLLARILMISSIPLGQIVQYLVAAHVLCRWTTLPLSYFCPPAREVDGQGARIAKLTTRTSLALGTIFTVLVVGVLLRQHSVAPLLAAVAVTLVSARFYMLKIGGVTGDCFGATNQITEIAVYLCGAWIV